jgi:hypothetical protein
MASTFVDTFEERVSRIFDGILVEDLVGAEPKIVKMLVAAKYLTIVDTEDGKIVELYNGE